MNFRKELRGVSKQLKKLYKECPTVWDVIKLTTVLLAMLLS